MGVKHPPEKQVTEIGISLTLRSTGGLPRSGRAALDRPDDDGPHRFGRYEVVETDVSEFRK
jgi:hypothetical protein